MTAGLIVLFLILVPLAFPAESQNGNCSYYWTLYNGTTPKDAIPGGQDPAGESFYIGLIQLKLINEMFAGMIIPKTKTARITSLGITREVKNDHFTVVSVLCSENKEAFSWIPTKSADLHYLISKNDLVNGGKVLGQDLYIGRVHRDNGTVLGKVFPHKFIYQGLYVPYKGVFKQFMVYEVLKFYCADEKN